MIRNKILLAPRWTALTRKPSSLRRFTLYIHQQPIRKLIPRIQQIQRLDKRPHFFQSTWDKSSKRLTSSTASYATARRHGMRNIAVIAHVDHGKTSLVDKLLVAADNLEAVDRLMDSGDLEKERGITITSKVTRLQYGDVIINMADTPGHSDFSAEVDRILGVADGFVLVVDATEGPKSQTKYVLTRALALGLKPIVVLNKCDRSTSRLDETETQILDLFDVLGATEEQLEYITVYASAREGWVTTNDDLSEKQSMGALLDLILEQIPEPTIFLHDSASQANESLSLKPEAFLNDRFSLAAVSVGYDSFLGRTCSGRIMSGSIRKNENVIVLPRSGQLESSGPPSAISGIFVHEGIRRVPFEQEACAGDYVTLTGVPDSICVGDTLTGVINPVEEPIDTPPLAPPTLAMDFGANDGPLAGQEGSRIASSQIRDRLMSEADNNVTLKITENESDVDKTVVYARGELQLGILVEQMRREGFELLISPPRILTKICPDTAKTLEPYEELVVDVDSEYAGAVINLLTSQERQAVLQSMSNQEEGKTQLVFEMPSRGMLGGFRSELATATRGSAIVHHIFIGDRERTGSESSLHEKGKLVSNASGKASSFALSTLEARGILFVGPGEDVYSGMVIGENSRPGDLEVNPIKAKEKTNMRTQSKDEKIQLSNPKRMSVEELIAYMSPDEMIEVTPVSVRLRKKLLDSGARERAARSKAKQLRALKE